MSVPTNFKSAISSKNLDVRRWVEIEGIPYAYGTMAQDASFFSARAANQRFLGIRQQLLDIPKNLDQSVDTLMGGALTTGQTDFEISDQDGEPTKWTGVGLHTDQLVLDGQHTATQTTFSFFGTFAPTHYLPGDYFYIGTETIKIGLVVGSTFTGCTRAQFRSKAQPWGSGTPILWRAYAMANRRVWYNEVAVIKSTGALLSSTDPDRCVRFAGACRSFRMKDDTFGAYVLTAESMDRELDRLCFRTLRSFVMKQSVIMDALGANGDTQVPGFPGFWVPYNRLYFFNAAEFPTVPESVIFKIDNEFFQGVRSTGFGRILPSIALTRRGLFQSDVVAHQEGTLVKEVVVLSRFVSGGEPQQASSKFTSVPTVGSPLDVNHPLIFLLQVLLSTGTGLNTAGGGARNYDVLPDGWGMNVDYTRVDIRAIEAAAMEEPGLKFSGIIDEPRNFVALAREVLSFCGYYYIITVGDKFTIRRLRPPLPDVATVPINQGNRIRKFFTKWEANWSGAIRELVFKYGWDIIAGKYRRIDILISDAGEIYSKGLARSLVFETKLLYPGASGIPGEVDHEAFDIPAWLTTRKDFYMTRYAIPPPIIRERLDYSYLDLEIGDIVDITHPNLPDAATGARGLVNAVGEVIGKSISDKSHTIDFTVLMTGWMLGNYRFISPSMEIIAADDFQSWFCRPNQFTSPNGPYAAGAQNDGIFEKSSGALVHAWDIGIPLWCWKPDFSHRQYCYVTSAPVDGTVAAGYPSVYFTADPSGGVWDAEFGGTPGVGCFFTLADGPSEDALVVDGETLLAKYAYGTTSAFYDGSAPHKFFPL